MFSRSTNCLKGEGQEELPGRVSARSGRGTAGAHCRPSPRVPGEINESLLIASAERAGGAALPGSCTEGSGT